MRQATTQRLVPGIAGAALLGLVAGCDVEKTKEGNVTLPKYEVTTPSVEVGTKKTEVTVPTVEVKSAEEKKAEKDAAAAAASEPAATPR